MINQNYYCYFAGKILPLKQARLPLTDVAVLRGYAVFDFLKTVNGKPFLWREHWQRFVKSARALNLRIPMGESEVLEIITKLFSKNKLRDGSIRLLLTGGVASDGMSIGTPALAIIVEGLHSYPPAIFRAGAKVITHEYLRTIPGAKTTNYISALRLQAEKQKRNALEILFTHRGLVMECSTSNFFLIKRGKIITPVDDILFGTTRGLVIKLSRTGGFVLRERAIKIAELRTADEAFLTATNKDIIPIVSVDNFKIGEGKVGPITRQLMAKLGDYKANY